MACGRASRIVRAADRQVRRSALWGPGPLPGVAKALSAALHTVTGWPDNRGLGVDRFVDRRAR